MFSYSKPLLSCVKAFKNKERTLFLIYSSLPEVTIQEKIRVPSFSSYEVEEEVSFYLWLGSTGDSWSDTTADGKVVEAVMGALIVLHHRDSTTCDLTDDLSIR